MPNNQTKRLAQGAMMTAIFAILIAIAFYVPLISLVATIFAPLPLAWYSATYDQKTSIFVAIIAIAVTFFFGGLFIIPFSLIFASIGLSIGITLKLKKSKLFMLMATGLTMLFAFSIEYIVSVQLFEFDFIQESIQLVRTSYEKSLELTTNITGQTPLTMEDLELIFVTLETSIPASITLALFAFSFIIILVNLPILKRLGIVAPKFGPFKDLKLPRSVLWYYLIVLSINLFIRPEIGSTLYVICLNLSMVLWVLLTIQGLSFIHYFLDKKFNASNFVKIIVTILAIPLYSFVILIGIIDLGFDIRSLVKDKIQK